jgi:hypothetical protein
MKLAGATLLMLSMSTLVVACGDDADISDRAALERESLNRELEMALLTDSAQQPTLTDIPLDSVAPPVAPPVAAPAPAPRPTSQNPPPAQQTPPRPPATTATRPNPAPAPAPAAPRMVSYTVPAGTTFGVRLSQTLSTENNPVGSTFTAVLTEAILAPNGTVLIPSGSTVTGSVIESAESGRSGQDARLSVAFTSISAGGKTYSISGSAANASTRLVTRDSKTEQAAKIGGAAAVGAIIGRVLGRDTKSTVAGAAVGAAAGTAVAVGTAKVDAVMDSGTNITIRMDRPITVEKEG